MIILLKFPFITRWLCPHRATQRKPCRPHWHGAISAQPPRKQVHCGD